MPQAMADWPDTKSEILGIDKKYDPGFQFVDKGLGPVLFRAIGVLPESSEEQAIKAENRAQNAANAQAQALVMPATGASTIEKVADKLTPTKKLAPIKKASTVKSAETDAARRRRLKLANQPSRSSLFISGEENSGSLL